MRKTALMQISCALVMLGVLAVVLCGCEPISVAEPPKESDMNAYVLAIANPDTLQTGQLCRIQISLQNICGGTYTGDQPIWSGRELTLTPTMHVVSGTSCTGGSPAQTIVDTMRLSQTGMYDLDVMTGDVIEGQNIEFQRVVYVLASFPTRNWYSIRCRFQIDTSKNQAGSPFHSTDFQFLNRPPSYPFTIIADASGEWDTTFVDTLPRVQYMVSDYYTFEAVQGVKDDLVILVPP